MKKIEVCSAYEINGKKTDFFPTNTKDLENAKCIYETVDGWEQDLTEIDSFDDLCENARKYVSLLEHLVKRPITIIGVGPKRKQTIFRK
jgi:adenylosuccinate synthase